MPPNRYRGPPMTLANMRAQGVCSLWVVCEDEGPVVLNSDASPLKYATTFRERLRRDSGKVTRQTNQAPNNSYKNV
jgi:hypothetical protein